MKRLDAIAERLPRLSLALRRHAAAVARLGADYEAISRVLHVTRKSAKEAQYHVRRMLGARNTVEVIAAIWRSGAIRTDPERWGL